MSVFGKIKNFFVGIKVIVSDIFVKVFGKESADEIGKFIVAGLKSALGVIVEQVVVAMLTLKVTDVDGTVRPATSAEMRAEAFKQIVEKAKAQGLSFSASIINLLIEMAVQKAVKQNVSLQQ